ncbi:stigma-specific STIG1-like protein 4 [Andrographis paniculata]|uniref:stigma-specific STIG1-like protein 4 n=1 Tax=Andrographis paniculata TaxID=175694 RepID=UPI0021E8DF72|nr:stigma-specific STIG1-like protein 4 [Andrographis paniculata]
MHPTIFLIIFLLIPLAAAAAAAASRNTTITSPWLRQSINHGRRSGCRWQPWICDVDNHGGDPEAPRVRRRCCRNRCVDVFSDVNNCGMCRIRCRFTRQCCRGICVNTNRNPYHCGRCGRRCRWPSRCVYGMCGYAEEPRPKHDRRRRPPPAG